MHQIAGRWTVYAPWPLALHKVKPRRWLPKGVSTFNVKVKNVWFTLTGKSWKGIAAVAEWPEGSPPTPSVTPFRQWEYPSMAIKRRTTEVKDSQHLAAVETQIFNGMMSLVEHCCLLKYEDGQPRQPGWVTIKTNGAAWTVQVKDPDTACSFAAVADTLDKALETASLLLACDDAPWERDRFLVEQAGRNKKK